jgi:hypothetical protein
LATCGTRRHNLTVGLDRNGIRPVQRAERFWLEGRVIEAVNALAAGACEYVLIVASFS